MASTAEVDAYYKQKIFGELYLCAKREFPREVSAMVIHSLVQEWATALRLDTVNSLAHFHEASESVFCWEDELAAIDKAKERAMRDYDGRLSE